MKKEINFFFFFVVFFTLNFGHALDRKLVERMPALLDTNYLQQVIRSTELSSHSKDFFHGFSEMELPSLALQSSDISVSNWQEGKCLEVQQKIRDARGFFSQFRAVAIELAEILAKDYIDEKTEAHIFALQKKMEELRKQILAVYPEIFDSWEIKIAIKWKFPKGKIFVDKNFGPLFSLLSVTTPHIHWQSDGASKTPDSLTYKTKYPNILTLMVKSVPAEFCVSPFRVQAFGRAGGNAMNTIYVHLFTHRSVQFF
ncbi:MAG: hypothetical protein A4S09_10105 [Proteobacteria bacterium SG_bin7]|nr:MAG: hypothetical protein A4S09_10105 [Proteobacteria bacterium SG_bin7]